MEYTPWVLEVYGEADWKLGSTEIQEASFCFWDKQLQYNQLDTGKTDCTLYASMWAISDLVWKQWTLEERQDIHNKAIAQWLSPKDWRWLYKAVDLIRREYNKTVPFDQILSSYTMKVGSEEFWSLLFNNYSVITGYRGNRAYNEDVNDNCIVDNDDIGASTYWHCIRLTIKGKFIYVVDNYFWKKQCNVYRIDVFKQLVAKWVFFNNWYIFISKQPIMENKLPPHMTPEQAPWLSDEIKARENDMPTYIQNWWKYTANNYMLPPNNTNDKYEHLKIWVKMYADINNARS